jgi:dihydropteroate synthase
MHMHGEPQTMQRSPMAGDAVPQVREFLRERSEALRGRGISVSRIAWDPGIGFGKTVEQNFALLARQRELLHDGYPLLAGWSRKSSLGTVTGEPVQQRLAASVTAAVLAVEKGARIVRVHEVRETVAALKVWSAMEAALDGPGESKTS